MLNREKIHKRVVQTIPVELMKTTWDKVFCIKDLILYKEYLNLFMQSA